MSPHNALRLTQRGANPMTDTLPITPIEPSRARGRLTPVFMGPKTVRIARAELEKVSRNQ
jgi:hypothetical protein